MNSSLLLVFILGILTGNQLYHLSRCLPQGEGYHYTCRNCREQLSWWAFPPLGTLLRLGKRCRCGASFKLLTIELFTGGLFVLCLVIQGAGLPLLKALLFVSFLILITLIDLDHKLILDKVVGGLAGVGALLSIAFPEASGLSFADMLSGAILGGGVMLLIAVLSRGGMGGGDIKLMAAVGVWFGLKHTLLTLLLSFILGGIGSAAVLILGLKGRRDFIPFGPFIALGALLVLLYGPLILTVYFPRLGNP